MIDTGSTIVEVAREIGIGEQLLGRWVASESARMVDLLGAIHADERAEVERLPVEKITLQMNREFLKSDLLR